MQKYQTSARHILGPTLQVVGLFDRFVGRRRNSCVELSSEVRLIRHLVSLAVRSEVAFGSPDYGWRLRILVRAKPLLFVDLLRLRKRSYWSSGAPRIPWPRTLSRTFADPIQSVAYTIQLFNRVRSASRSASSYDLQVLSRQLFSAKA